MDSFTIKKELKEKLGISYLLPHQELIINQIAYNEENGKNTRLLAVLPTGSGKSICFMAPTIFVEGIIVCIYPLLSLMADQERRMNTLNIKSVVIKGGMEKRDRDEKIKDLIEGKYRVMITNIEMLLCLAKNKGNDALWKKVSTLVIDEVHTAISWGNTFRPSFKELPLLLSRFTLRHILAFTATLDETSFYILKDRVFLGESPYVVRSSADRSNIFYHSVHTLKMEYDLLKIVKTKKLRPAVVFAKTRLETERLSSLLMEHGIKSLFYHAGLDKEERKIIEDTFSASSDSVLVATNAYGMGVDKKDIRSVIHTYLPTSAEDFLQESGRGGRDGSEAHSFVLWKEKDEGELKKIFSGGGCIRNGLLRKMGEETENDKCVGCSFCITSSFIPSGEDEILKEMARHPFRRKKGVIKRLRTPTITNPLPPLRKWTMKEVEDAIEEEVISGNVKSKGRILRLTKNGKKRLSQLLYSK